MNNCKLFLISMLTFLGMASSVTAYDFRPGDWFMRGLIGAEINVVRYRGFETATPGGGLLLGIAADYVLDFNWGISGDIKANFSPDFVDLTFSPGVKYWFTRAQLPFVPYVGLYLPFSLLIPTNAFSSYWNIGLRPALGLKYFIIRNFAVGAETGLTPGIMFSSRKSVFELAVDAALVFTWRL